MTACLAGGILACAWSGQLRLPAEAETAAQDPAPSATMQPQTLTQAPPPTPTLTPVPEVRLNSAERAVFMGDWKTAASEYSAVLSSAEDPEIKSAALLGLGRTYYLDGKYQEAALTLEQCLQEHPQSAQRPFAFFALAQAYAAQGRYAEASQAYQNYLDSRPGVIDAYALNFKGEALRAAGDYTAAIREFRAALEAPSLLDPLDIQVKIALAHAEAGDYPTAIALYDQVYASATNDFLKAEMDLRKGQAFTALGQVEDAHAAYLDAVNNFPTSYDTYQALVALVEASVPVSELSRGIIDYHAGQYGVALAAFDRYLQGEAPEMPTARYYNGLTLRALGGHEDAIREWDKIIVNFPEDRFWDDAWEQKAYTQWAYLEQYEAAIQTLLDFVAAAPDHARAGEFLYDAATVAERDGRLDQAADLWERVFVEYNSYERAWRALYLAGITRFRQGDYPKAYGLFSRALAGASTLEERAASYLWEGKVQLAMGDKASAQATWELGANVDPTGYYSERARDLLRGLAPFSPPQTYDFSMDILAERAQAEAWLRETFDLPEDTDLSTPGPLISEARFQRGNELWRLGLYDEARAEFEDLRASFQTSPLDNYRLANHLLQLGLYRPAILATRQVLNLAGLNDADTMTAPAYFNHVRFGPYFADLITPTAQKYNFHPLFLFSLVRQESAFEGFVHSSAGARGLMQIVPATGQEIAANLGWPPDYSDEDLYRPLVSITLGADYLATWRDRLGGDIYAALAAYNGGPGNAMQWQSLANNDPDLFLEIVRFEETRDYIRGVYENFNIYRRLYDRTP